jgi:hypothetical protein
VRANRTDWQANRRRTGSPSVWSNADQYSLCCDKQRGHLWRQAYDHNAHLLVAVRLQSGRRPFTPPKSLEEVLELAPEQAELSSGPQLGGLIAEPVAVHAGTSVRVVVQPDARLSRSLRVLSRHAGMSRTGRHGLIALTGIPTR